LGSSWSWSSAGGHPGDPLLDEFGQHGGRVVGQVLCDDDGQAEVDVALRVERFEQPVARAGLGE
jgi:hypothetical protein